MCREANAFTQELADTKPFLRNVTRSEGAADIRLTDISQPCEKHSEHTWSISVHVRGEPGRLALLHACLDWVGVVMGVAALSEGRGTGSDKASQLAQSCPLAYVSFTTRLLLTGTLSLSLTAYTGTPKCLAFSCDLFTNKERGDKSNRKCCAEIKSPVVK